MLSKVVVWLGLALAFGVAACSETRAPAPELDAGRLPDAGIDGGTDAGGDSGAPLDGGRDAGEPPLDADVLDANVLDADVLDADVLDADSASAELDAGDASDDGGLSRDDGGMPAEVEPIDLSSWTAFAPDDAVYSPAQGVIVMTSKSEPRALVVRASDGFTSWIELAAPGTAITLSPDEQDAAIGHNGSVSLVDLFTQTVTSELDTSVSVFDLVWADNGYIYVTALGTQWTELLALDVAANVELPQATGQVYGSMKLAWLRESDRLYAIDTRLNPVDVHRFDISGGAVVQDGDSPYHGDFPICDELFMPFYGQYVLNGCGTVFRLASGDQDLVYRGSLELPYEVRGHQLWHADIARQHGRLAVVPNADEVELLNGPAVYLYAGELFTTLNRIPTPALIDEGELWPARPRFAFFGPTDEALFVVLTANEASSAVATHTYVWRAPAPPVGVVVAPDDDAAVAIPGDSSLLGLRVVDAQYDEAHDRLVVVSTEPSALTIIDPEDPAQRQTAALYLAPHGLSLSPDGLTAAVAHDGYVSFVDLEQPVVFETIQVPERLTEVVLADDAYSWVYGWSDRSLQDVHALDLSAGELTLTGPFRDLGNAFLHPDGDRIYGGNDNDGVHRLDLSSPSVPVSRPAPYGAGTMRCRDIWLAEGGDWAITCNEKVISIDSQLDDDRRYITSLGTSDFPGASWLIAADHSEERELVLAAFVPERRPLLGFYDTTYFELQSELPVPEATVDGEPTPVTPRWVFFSNDGDRFYVLADIADTGLVRPSALLAMDTPAPNLAPITPAPGNASAFSGFRPFDGMPVDAAYSDALDCFAIISESPHELIVHETGTNVFDRIPLPKAATRVSIDPSGERAVVAHPGFVTLIDLGEREIIATLPLPAVMHDLALTADGWVYASNADSPWPAMHALNTSTGVATEYRATTGNDYDLQRFVVLADGSRGYGQSSQTSLSRFDPVGHAPWPLNRLDLSTAVRDGLWLSDDETRLFTGSGTLWQIDAVAMNDRIYVDRVDNIASLNDADHAGGRGLYAMLARFSTTGVRNFSRVDLVDDGTLELIDDLPLPSFMIAGAARNATGRWLAFDSSENAVHVVVSASQGSLLGPANAVVTLPVP